jgi:hypothetical protein
MRRIEQGIRVTFAFEDVRDAVRADHRPLARIPPENDPMNAHQQWIVTTDSRHAKIYSWQRTPGGEVHIEELRAIRNEHEAEHERGRPSELGISHTGAPGRGVPQGGAQGHTSEEEHRKFARELIGRGGWLCRTIEELQAERVHLFAATRFLGLLREVMATQPGRGCGRAIEEHVEFHDADLTHLKPHELAVHPAVVRLAELKLLEGRH